MRSRPAFNIDKLFMDVTTTLVALFACMFAIISQIAVVKDKDSKEKADSAQIEVGAIVVSARWKDGLDCDVDLWVKAPEDRLPVGYSRRSDIQSGYARDDIGMGNDRTTLNLENTYVRGAVAGKYIINLHLYSARICPLPVRVQVEAVLMPTKAVPSKILHSISIPLTENGQEVTAFSFELNSKGQLVPGSVSRKLIKLRN